MTTTTTTTHAPKSALSRIVAAGTHQRVLAFTSLIILLIIWRLYEGMQRSIGNGETTLFLHFPVWWGYAASFTAGVIACIIAVYCAVIRVFEAIRGENILPSEQGAH